MKSVGVREFRDHASKYLDTDEILSIERHGRTIGYFIPAHGEPTVAERRARLEEALDGLARISNEIQERTGLTEDEVADMFDIHKST
jgi:antitoxin (DNA-binding transcriptional repressor) of toxin-antitoxin stability system